ncbi:hypothetical protein DACRYDRAFT_107412 [Dacryopinax primogenitus]|uniref:Uncharacterized protein n=1 Tax=Dacryopinax primogenitus (strain DJM 731) TaxID=1858805 RepID=M5G2Q0_DACPD|nr:uncharacterized protein DACRYDRAFT_107412 [Dacryopinax primogenitus]EJU02495.1 hypothetical protein DACRYDRAFT_107412 [Dacryopinax primogenitus]
MAHKRPKRSVREQEQKQRGFDHAPKTAEKDDAPRGAMRVLNAQSIRAEYKEKKRKREEEPTGQEKTSKKRKTEAEKEKEELKLRPGERLEDFNRRVDRALKPRIKASKASKAKAIISEKEAAPESAPPPTKKERKTDFDSLPLSRRVNDIAQAPPSLTRLPQNAAKKGEGREGKEGVLSLATRAALEEERARVVERYRLLKESKIKEKEMG